MNLARTLRNAVAPAVLAAMFLTTSVRPQEQPRPATPPTSATQPARPGRGGGRAGRWSFRRM